jgi:hypothetical protein
VRRLVGEYHLVRAGGEHHPHDHDADGHDDCP